VELIATAIARVLGRCTIPRFHDHGVRPVALPFSVCVFRGANATRLHKKTLNGGRIVGIPDKVSDPKIANVLHRHGIAPFPGV